MNTAPKTPDQMRVVIAGRDAVWRYGMMHYLNQHVGPLIFGEAANVPTARAFIADHQPDLLLLQHALPGGNGLDLVREAKWSAETNPLAMRTLVFGPPGDVLAAEAILQAGGCGYVEQGDNLPEVLEAVRWVLGGRLYLGIEMYQAMIKLQAGKFCLPVEKLSWAEGRVWQGLIQLRSTREISTELGLSIKTIESHLRAIRKKFGLKTLEQLRQQALYYRIRKTLF